MLKINKENNVEYKCDQLPVYYYYIAVSFYCRRSNNYGSTPAQPNVETGNGNGNGNNNNAPATPSQIFCLHGRSNNVEVEGESKRNGGGADRWLSCATLIYYGTFRVAFNQHPKQFAVIHKLSRNRSKANAEQTLQKNKKNKNSKSRSGGRGEEIGRWGERKTTVEN